MMMSNDSGAQSATAELPSGAKSIVGWKRIENSTVDKNASTPKPRHGHRAVSFRHYMILYGGGNQRIVDEFHVFDTISNHWFTPILSGTIPDARAAAGLIVDQERLLLFGGMIEYGAQVSSLYELNLFSWKWRELEPQAPPQGPPPCPRMCHSLTMINDKAYLFGGLTNCSAFMEYPDPRFLNDLYVLHVRQNNGHGVWEQPQHYGTPPFGREGHTAVAYQSPGGRHNKLIIYGGMNGIRLADMYLLDVDTMVWTEVRYGGKVPRGRSLHTASIVDRKMYVFGGWLSSRRTRSSEGSPATASQLYQGSTTVSCLDLETLTWEDVLVRNDPANDSSAGARAGHTALTIGTRIYIWSGRECCATLGGANTKCWDDFWILDVQRPSKPSKIQLVRAGTKCLELKWNMVPGADTYILQCVPCDNQSERRPSIAIPLGRSTVHPPPTREPCPPPEVSRMPCLGLVRSNSTSRRS